MKSKIHRATVTQADLDYVGSVAIDAALMEAADLLEGEQVAIVDITNGAIRDLATFQPSAAFVGLQDYFDAYTFSFSPWSPEGGQLAYGADDGVYIIDTAAGSATKKAEGALGMWLGGR